MMNRLSTLAQLYLIAVTTSVGAATAGIGIWCLVDPNSFADAVGFDAHRHFLHDVGAFQLGLGVTLLLALLWADALATALAGFVMANTVHTVNHVVDLDVGGSVAQAWILGVVSLALVLAFVLRLRQLGYVLGSVGTATSPTLAPFVRQKTIALITFRKDGTPGSARSALWWKGIAPTFEVSNGRSKSAESAVTRASNSAQQRPRASRRDPRYLAACAC